MEAVLRRVQAKLKEKVSRMQKPGEFFQSKRRWELRELQEDLNSSDTYKQRAAIKRVIATMTLGRDVSSLFVDVVKLGQTNNLELKKLVYLYILSNAKLQPEAALLAVNSFLLDSESPSPLVRALAIRTMMCIRVQGVLEYTVEALRRAAADTDPYVRKTAVIGIGKLFHHDRALFSDGFDSLLVSMLADSCPLVVSNAAAILAEVRDYSLEDFDLDQKASDWLRSLQLALNEANEWGQVYILELMAEAKPLNSDFAEVLVSKALPLLNHSNSAVVMAAIKVIANLAGKCNATLLNRLSSRVSTAVLTLTKGDPETQYVVFKNIQALLVIFPALLRQNLDAFYVRFHDPQYVKREKLRLLLKLVTPATAEAVVKELHEYSGEVDFLFLEDVVMATASLAIKIQSVAEQCARLLLRMLHRHRALLSNVVIASKNILRKYPQLLILNTLIQHHGVKVAEVGDVEARTALIWMLGEYCDHVKDGRQILLGMVDDMLEQEQPVQLALLTAIVKVFVRDGNQNADVLKSIFERLTTHSDDPDTRDRAIGYWRLLSRGHSAEKVLSVLCGPRGQSINVDSAFSDSMTLKDLKKSLNTVAAVLGRPYQTFLPSYGLLEADASDDDEDDDDEEREGEGDAESQVKDGVVESVSASRSESRTGPSAASIEDRGCPGSPYDNLGAGGLSAASPAAISTAPISEEEFQSAWEALGNVSVARRSLRVGRELAEAEVSRVTRWMNDHDFVVAAVISSLNKLIFMASAPTIDRGALLQIVVERPPSTGPATMIVKSVTQQLVHVLALQFEKIASDPAALAPPPKPNGMSLDALFS
eukprot:gene6622-4742_t